MFDRARALANRKAREASPVYSPTAQARERSESMRTGSGFRADRRLMGQGLKGRTPSKCPVCPARQFAKHPDKDLRVLAQTQADEFHVLSDVIEHGHLCNGKCRGKACKAQRSGVSTNYSGKVAINWRQRIGRNVLGGGAF